MALNMRKSEERIRFLAEFQKRIQALYDKGKFRSYAHAADIAQEKGFNLKTDAVSKYLSGTEPGAYGVAALAALFEVSADYLLTGKERKTEDNEIKKILKQLDTMRGEAYNLTDPRLEEYAKRFAALPEGLRKAAEQLLKAMEDTAKQKDTD